MQLNISAGRGKTFISFAKFNYRRQLYMTCMIVHSKHMWKYSSLSIQTSTGNSCVVQISKPPPLNFPTQERLIARFIQPGYHPGLHSAPAASALSLLLPVSPHNQRARMALWKHSEHRHWLRNNCYSWYAPEIMNILAQLWKLWIFQLSFKTNLFHFPYLK